MITSYKIKLFEGEKSVKQEIELIGDNKDEIVTATKELYTLLKPFCLKETLDKQGLR